MNPHDVIQRPLLSEKAVSAIEAGKYVFFVHPHANRIEIKDAVERVFEVDVVRINLAKVRGKVRRQGRTSGRDGDRKKAIVTLAAGQRIRQLEGLT